MAIKEGWNGKIEIGDIADPLTAVFTELLNYEVANQDEGEIEVNKQYVSDNGYGKSFVIGKAPKISLDINVDVADTLHADLISIKQTVGGVDNRNRALKVTDADGNIATGTATIMFGTRTQDAKDLDTLSITLAWFGAPVFS